MNSDTISVEVLSSISYDDLHEYGKYLVTLKNSDVKECLYSLKYGLILLDYSEEVLENSIYNIREIVVVDVPKF